MTSWRFFVFAVCISAIAIVEAKKPGRCKPCGLNEKRTKCPTCEFSCDQRDRMCAAVVKCQKKSVCQCLPGHFRLNEKCVPEKDCPAVTSNPPATTTLAPTDGGFFIVKKKETKEHYEHIDLLKQSTARKLEGDAPKPTSSIDTKKTTDLPEDYGLIVISQKVKNTKSRS